MRLRTSSLVISGLICVISTAFCQTKTTYSQEVKERIDQVENSLGTKFDNDNLNSISTQLSKYKINGLSIAVINNFEVEWAKAYGVTDNLDQNPVTTQTVFQAASMSKTVNALALLKLVESRHLDLDTDVNTLIKTWQLPYNTDVTDKKVTLRQILSHTAGLSIHGFNGYRRTNDLPNIVQILTGQKPAKSKEVVPITAPNREFRYSGGGTTLSQLVLMDTENSTYEQYVQERLFQPLGLKDAFYSIEFDKYKGKTVAHGHFKSGKPLKNKFDYHPASAAAGLWISPTDLAKVLIDLQLSLNGREAKVLSQELAIEMITPPIQNDISALGVFIEKIGKETYLQHSGTNNGFRGKYFISATNGQGVVIMVNGPRSEIIEEIIQSVARIYEWSGFEQMKIADISFTNAEIDAYTGTYQFNKRSVEVSYKNSSFIMTEKDKWASRILPLSKASFILEDVKPQAMADFVIDKDGKVTKIIVTQGVTVTWTKTSSK